MVNQYVSVEAARDLYGVVVDPDTLALDEKATTALRKKLKKEAAKKAPKQRVEGAPFTPVGLERACRTSPPT